MILLSPHCTTVNFYSCSKFFKTRFSNTCISHNSLWIAKRKIHKSDLRQLEQPKKLSLCGNLLFIVWELAASTFKFLILFHVNMSGFAAWGFSNNDWSCKESSYYLVFVPCVWTVIPSPWYCKPQLRNATGSSHWGLAYESTSGLCDSNYPLAQPTYILHVQRCQQLRDQQSLRHIFRHNIVGIGQKGYKFRLVKISYAYSLASSCLYIVSLEHKGDKFSFRQNKLPQCTFSQRHRRHLVITTSVDIVNVSIRWSLTIKTKAIITLNPNITYM